MNDSDLLALQGEDTSIPESEPTSLVFDAEYIGADLSLRGRAGQVVMDSDGSLWFEAPDWAGYLKAHQVRRADVRLLEGRYDAAA
jgi:hypothetical protein